RSYSQIPPPILTPAPISWSDLSGRKYGLADIRRNRATVFFFVSTKCPVSNLYVPRMADLARQFQSRAVQFFLVDSNIEDTDAEVTKYAAEHDLPFPAAKDSGTALADRLGARITPEAFVL